jgi:hypothetical protein
MSCNEDPLYSSFWIPVAWAYKKMFPNVKVHLALLTSKGDRDDMVRTFRKYGEVTIFKPVSFVPEGSQAKMIRYILASEQGNDVCYLDDIDLFPLNKAFITDKIDQRPKDTVLCVGGEVYENNGCYPLSQMTVEGYVWKRFINPKNLNYSDLLTSWLREPMFDRRENMLLETDMAKDDYFNDEIVIKRLIHENPVPKKELQRGYRDFLEATIDRHDWTAWDKEKLKNHKYMNAHGIRPFDFLEYQPLVDYIKENYE